LIGGYRDNVPKSCEFYEFDLMELDKIDVLFKRPIDIVIHAACTAHEGLSVFSPALITKNTFQITMNLLSKSIKYKVKKFIYMSSMARYGNQKYPFTEDLQPLPQDPYGIAKVASELAIRNLCETHGMEFCILVPHNDPYRNVVSIMINRMLQGKQPVIYGDGQQERCFSFISDVVNPIIRACLTDTANGRVINIGPDEEPVSINELAHRLAKIMNFDLDPIYVSARPREVKNATCSAQLSREILGYETKVLLDEGLETLISYIKDRGVLPFKYDFEIEIESELTPSTWTGKLI